MVSWRDEEYMGNGMDDAYMYSGLRQSNNPRLWGSGVRWQDQDYMGNGVRWQDDDYMGNGYCDDYDGGAPSAKWNRCRKQVVNKRWKDVDGVSHGPLKKKYHTRKSLGRATSEACRGYTKGYSRKQRAPPTAAQKRVRNLAKKVMAYKVRMGITLAKAWEYARRQGWY